MTVVFYITGHGFGHATRELEIIRQIVSIRRDVRIVVRTAVPRWFLEKSARAPIDVQFCEADTGIKQIDSLRLDEAGSVEEAIRFYATFDDRVHEEARALRELRASVVVGDVPPLAFAAAHHAGIPSVAVANFTWDWIYAAYPAFQAAARHVLSLIGAAYAHADLALRLPFAGGFATMRTIRDVPLVARHSRRSRADNRLQLGIDDQRPVVLGSFGGHGAVLPYRQVAESSDITLILTDYEARSLPPDASRNGRLRCFSGAELDAADIRYEDLVAAADVVVSKPGYGIVSECVSNQTALLYTSRGVFAENDVIIDGMKRLIRCGFIAEDDLRAARWEPSIRELLAQPAPTGHMPIDGARAVAQAILDVA